MAVIKVDKLTKNYGDRRGNFDVSFEVNAGEVYGFLGPNGAGKTTTIRQILGFIKPDSGKAYINGIESNAIKFSKQNGIIKISITRNQTHENGGFCFEIADNGIGIKESDKERIFDHFYMADASRNTDGNGLGLPIVKMIIGRLGGGIGFESQENEGSKFFVNI